MRIGVSRLALRFAARGAFAMMAAVACHASVIYTTFGPGDAYTPGLGWTIGQATLQQEVAVSFVPAVDSVLEEVRVATFLSNAPNDFRVYLALDNSGQPGAPLETFEDLMFTSPGTILTLPSITNPGLAAGATYWVVMSADNLSASHGGWNVNSQGYTGLLRRFQGGGWVADSNETPALEVSAQTAAPEPSTWVIALSGLAALACRPRRTACRLRLLR